MVDIVIKGVTLLRYLDNNEEEDIPFPEDSAKFISALTDFLGSDRFSNLVNDTLDGASMNWNSIQIIREERE